MAAARSSSAVSSPAGSSPPRPWSAVPSSAPVCRPVAVRPGRGWPVGRRGPGRRCRRRLRCAGRWRCGPVAGWPVGPRGPGRRCRRRRWPPTCCRPGSRCRPAGPAGRPRPGRRPPPPRHRWHRWRPPPAPPSTSCERVPCRSPGPVRCRAVGDHTRRRHPKPTPAGPQDRDKSAPAAVGGWRGEPRLRLLPDRGRHRPGLGGVRRRPGGRLPGHRADDAGTPAGGAAGARRRDWPTSTRRPAGTSSGWPSGWPRRCAAPACAATG